MKANNTPAQCSECIFCRGNSSPTHRRSTIPRKGTPRRKPRTVSRRRVKPTSHAWSHWFQQSICHSTRTQRTQSRRAEASPHPQRRVVAVPLHFREDKSNRIRSGRSFHLLLLYFQQRTRYGLRDLYPYSNHPCTRKGPESPQRARQGHNLTIFS